MVFATEEEIRLVTLEKKEKTLFPEINFVSSKKEQEIFREKIVLEEKEYVWYCIDDDFLNISSSSSSPFPPLEEDRLLCKYILIGEL